MVEKKAGIDGVLMALVNNASRQMPYARWER
jgi:hypothetical protein